jgi:hypothetical protein
MLTSLSKSMNLLYIMVLCLSASGATFGQPVLPDFSSAVFDASLQIDNPYFPLNVGTRYTYEGVKTDADTGEAETELIIVDVLDQARTVAGIESRVVRDRVWLEGLLIEDTFDWYAQDNQGNVWYLGEEVTDFEYDDEGNLIGTSHPGAWETGVDGALPGYIMEASPQVDDHYYQEYYPGEAEDHAVIVGVGETHTIPLGTYDDVLRIREFTLSPETYGEKFYAAGTGLIMEHEYETATGTLLAVTTLRAVAVVPEPRGLAFAAAGAVGLVSCRRRVLPIARLTLAMSRC